MQLKIEMCFYLGDYLLVTHFHGNVSCDVILRHCKSRLMSTLPLQNQDTDPPFVGSTNWSL